MIDCSFPCINYLRQATATVGLVIMSAMSRLSPQPISRVQDDKLIASRTSPGRLVGTLARSHSQTRVTKAITFVQYINSPSPNSLSLPPSHSLFLGCCFPRSLLVRPGTLRYVKIFVQQIYKIRYHTEVCCFQLTHEVQRQKEIDVLIVAQFKISLVRSVDIRHVV